MANEKWLVPDGKKVTLDDLHPGTIFAFGDDCLAVKSEYRCANGLIEAFIIGSGEQFWGGAESAQEQNALMVQPLAVEEVDAVPVVPGRWIEDTYSNSTYDADCSVCGEKIKWNGCMYDFNYCPNCGAKMDGGNEE